MLKDRATAWLPWILLIASAVLLAPLIPAVILALWLAAAARLVCRPLTRLLGGRLRLAAAITVVLIAALLIPFLLLLTSLAADAYQLVQRALQSPQGKQVLEQLASPSGAGAGAAPAAPGASNAGSAGGLSGMWDLVASQGDRAWMIIQQVAGTATSIFVALFVILAGTYSLLIEGDRWYGWVEIHGPLSSRMLGRLRDAFFETGRGLFIGIGGAGLAQAIIATVAYLVLRVPHALELGVLTLCFSVIPMFGTALVWAPVAAGLAFSGRTGSAIALVVCGVAVVGSIDNVVRPFLARRGRLQLPTYLVLVAMLAGVEVMGGWGLLLAPLAVRLTKEVLEARRDVPEQREPSEAPT